MPCKGKKGKGKGKRKCFIFLGILAFSLLLFSDGFSQVETKAENVEENVVEVATTNNEETDKKIKELEDKLMNYKNTYLDPLLAGITIPSVITAIVSTVFAILNRKNNKKTNEESSKVLTYGNSLFETITKLEKEIKESNEISEETKKILYSQIKKLIEKLETSIVEVQKVAELKSIINRFIVIQNKIVQQNKELVASGIAEELSKLVEDLNNLK